MSIAEDYEFRDAGAEDVGRINAFLDAYFHPEETMLQCLISQHVPALSSTDLSKIQAEQHLMIEAMTKSAPSYLLLERNSGDVAAVCVTLDTDSPAGEAAVYETLSSFSPLLRDYFDHMNALIADARLSERFPAAGRTREFYALAVSRAYRRRGLAARVFDYALKRARSDGVELAYALVTSPHSRRAAERAGMGCLVEFDLLQRSDDRGRSVFRDSSPHNLVAVVAVELGK